ncbi:MAG: hypothetical protein LBU34_00055 [Planctomycetaceae bacterium]|nr:hypothetical protein [Planctomycetaceae bacterium]
MHITPRAGLRFRLPWRKILPICPTPCKGGIIQPAATRRVKMPSNNFALKGQNISG